MPPHAPPAQWDHTPVKKVTVPYFLFGGHWRWRKAIRNADVGHKTNPTAKDIAPEGSRIACTSESSTSWSWRHLVTIRSESQQLKVIAPARAPDVLCSHDVWGLKHLVSLWLLCILWGDRWDAWTDLEVEASCKINCSLNVPWHCYCVIIRVVIGWIRKMQVLDILDICDLEQQQQQSQRTPLIADCSIVDLNDSCV